MQKTDTKIEDYISSLSEGKRGEIQRLDNIISKIMSVSSKVMWEGVFWGGSEQKIIGYGDLTYRSSKGEEVSWFNIGLALQKNYITVYVNVVDGKVYLAEKYKNKLGKVKVGRSSISFSSLESVNLDILEQLIKEAKELAAK